MHIDSYRNIMFDLGGVIINLSEEKTLLAFANLCDLEVSELRLQFLNSQYYKQFEKGLISASEFRDGVRDQLHAKSTDVEIDSAMNSMLLDIPIERIELLKKIKNRFRLFLLSNTNEIHLNGFNHIIHKTTGDVSIDHYFEKAYYSHLVNMRKPDTEIYQLVINQNNLIAEETLFLDDNETNLQGARQLGIQTCQITSPSILLNLFK